MKQFIKSLTLYQIIYLAVVMIITTCFIIFFPNMIIQDATNTVVVICSVIAVLANPVCELLVSKQSRWNFILGIIFVETTEMILDFSLGFYISSITSFLFWVPLHIVSFIQWTKHPDLKNKEITEVKRLKGKQAVLVLMAIVVFSIGGVSDKFNSWCCI